MDCPHFIFIKTFQGQGHNFGDAPEPANIRLEFRDRDFVADSSYKVAAFNTLGESANE
jgi:hypothetical protein